MKLGGSLGSGYSTEHDAHSGSPGSDCFYTLMDLYTMLGGYTFISGLIFTLCFDMRHENGPETTISPYATGLS